MPSTQATATTDTMVGPNTATGDDGSSLSYQSDSYTRASGSYYYYYSYDDEEAAPPFPPNSNRSAVSSQGWAEDQQSEVSCAYYYPDQTSYAGSEEDGSSLACLSDSTRSCRRYCNDDPEAPTNPDGQPSNSHTSSRGSISQGADDDGRAEVLDEDQSENCYFENSSSLACLSDSTRACRRYAADDAAAAADDEETSDPPGKDVNKYLNFVRKVGRWAARHRVPEEEEQVDTRLDHHEGTEVTVPDSWVDNSNNNSRRRHRRHTIAAGVLPQDETGSLSATMNIDQLPSERAVLRRANSDTTASSMMMVMSSNSSLVWEQGMAIDEERHTNTTPYNEQFLAISNHQPSSSSPMVSPPAGVLIENATNQNLPLEQRVALQLEAFDASSAFAGQAGTVHLQDTARQGGADLHPHDTWNDDEASYHSAAPSSSSSSVDDLLPLDRVFFGRRTTSDAVSSLMSMSAASSFMVRHNNMQAVQRQQQQQHGTGPNAVPSRLAAKPPVGQPIAPTSNNRDLPLEQTAPSWHDDTARASLSPPQQTEPAATIRPSGGATISRGQQDGSIRIVGLEPTTLVAGDKDHDKVEDTDAMTECMLAWAPIFMVLISVSIAVGVVLLLIHFA